MKEEKPKNVANRISEEFKDEISAEKKLRESVDTQATEELLNKLKKKGTLRQ